MKKHLSLLFLFLLTAVVGLSAKTIDTKDLTVTAPDTWIAESSDVGYPISSLVTMSNASETEMLVIGVYEVDVDLQSFLQQQVVEGSNNFFTNASYVGEIRDEKLGDAPAKAVEFQTDVLGVPHRGTAYAAQASVGLCFTFYAYKTGTTPTSKSILSTLKFKDNVDVENKSLADRLSDFSKLIASNPLKIGDNLLQTKFDVNNTAKSILYEYKLTDTVADDATAEYMQSYMEENILSAFSDDFNSSDLVQEAARAGYTFKYRGVDQNGRQIYNVKLTPTDYAPLLR